MKLIIDIPKDAYEKAKTMGEAFGFPSPIVKAVAHGTPIIEARQETLEQEPCEDCIARQPLIDNWNSCADMLMNEGDSEIVMKWILDAPSVTPKTGHWISYMHGAYYECSNCKERNSRKDKHCPNCESKMVEPQESEG